MWRNMPTAAMSLSPVPTMNERNEPNPTRMAFGMSSRLWHSSPMTAPTKGPSRMPSGGMKKKPTTVPMVAPMAPAREPPKRRGGWGGGGAGACFESAGHVGGQEVVSHRDEDGDGEPYPQGGRGNLRIAAEVGADEARIAENDARKGRNDASGDADEREDKGEYCERGIHTKREPGERFSETVPVILSQI